jgi:nucleotide-binding universal stress UspA family protein
MTLSEAARERLADIVELQPTKNGELQDKWGMDSGSDVHQYLENELKEYYYRDDDSLIRATEEAVDLVDVAPGLVSGEDGTTTAVRVPRLQAQILDVVPPQNDDGTSVVATLHALRDAYDVDPSTDDVREALQALKRKGVVEVVYTTVPTFRLAVDRDELDVAVAEN